MDKDFEERFSHLIEGLLFSYEIIRTILGHLPIPIEVAGVLTDDWDPEQCERQLIRCLDLVKDQPLDPADARFVRSVIHDWLMVNDQLIILASMEGDTRAEWRFEAVAYALTRTMRLSEVVARNLGVTLE